MSDPIRPEKYSNKQTIIHTCTKKSMEDWIAAAKELSQEQLIDEEDPNEEYVWCEVNWYSKEKICSQE